MVDVQNEVPSHRIGLKSVGVVNMEYPVTVRRDGELYHLNVSLCLSVDLPKDQRGGHLSRFAENTERLLSTTQEVGAIEELAEKIAREQLKSHDYASRARVRLNTKVSFGNRVHEMFGSYDSKAEEKTIGVIVVGATACPCSMELTGGLSHNQRAVIEAELFMKSGENTVEAQHLVECCDNAFSTPLKITLKRPGEKVIVEEMHKNPRFVEDVVRECVHLLSVKYPGQKGRVKCTSYESIHPYDVFSEWEGVLGSE